MIEFDDIDFDDILTDGFSIVTEEIDLKDQTTDDKNIKQSTFPILPVRNLVVLMMLKAYVSI